MQKQHFLQIDPKDNLIVALTDLRAGTIVEVAGESITLKTDIAAKHKFSLVDLEAGDLAIMYGVIVGRAYQRI